jgi:CubicO group peptidase (beta-lactamase class C family)
MAASILIALAGALALAGAQEAAPPEAEAPAPAIQALHERDLSDIEAFTDGLAAAVLSEHPIPGLIVSVVQGEDMFAKGYGHSDVEAGRAASGDDVRFEIGSVSKTFIWTAVMMLEAEGVLDLHVDVNTYLTSFQAGRGGEPITLAQLMSHRPGLEDSFAIFLSQFAVMDRPEALARTEPRQVMGRGAATAYSNWGTVLAAQVVEDAAGMSYRDFLYSRILEPLGMTATTFLEGDARPDQPPLSVSYHIRDGAPVAAARVDIGAFGPAGSMASTAADMARWVRFHLNGGELDGVRLMPAETHARMLTRLYDDRPGGADMAHGFMHWRVDGVDVYGHGGSINEFLTMMAFAPELGVGVFASQNASPAFTPAFRLPDLVLARLIAEAGLSRAPDAAPENAYARALDADGRYIVNRRPHSGVEQVFAVSGVMTVRARGDGGLMVTDAMGQELYHPVGEDVWRNRHGRTIAAIRGPDGDVRRISDMLGTATYDRVGLSTDHNLLNAAITLALIASLTQWLGLWRRLGGRRRDGQAETARGLAVSIFNLVASGLVFAFMAMLLAATASLPSQGMEMFAAYPPPLLTAAMALAGAVVIAAVLAVAALVPAVAMSGWSMWRMMHHGLFALALAFLAWAMVNWGIAFGGHAGA